MDMHIHFLYSHVAEQGVEVHLVVDGISSQRLTDRQTALTVMYILKLSYTPWQHSTWAGTSRATV